MSNCANRDVCQLNHCPAIFEFLKFNRLFYQIINEIKLIYKYLFFYENTILRKSANCRKNSRAIFTGNGDFTMFSSLVITGRDLELFVSYDYARDFSYRASLSRR